MIERVIVRTRAKSDLREAQEWYREISPELAERLLNAVNHAIDVIRRRPHAFPVVGHSVRRVVLQHFPYSLYYYSDEKRIVVVAVLHHARDPRILAGRGL